MVTILQALISLYILAIIGVIIFSWFPQSPGGLGYSIFTFLRRITDPVLMPLRRIIPPVGGVLDLTPTIVIVVLIILRGAL